MYENNNEEPKKPNRVIYQIALLVLLILVIVFSMLGGIYYACNGTGKIIDHKCYSVIDVGYCTDYQGTKYFVDATVNMTRVNELNRSG